MLALNAADQTSQLHAAMAVFKTSRADELPGTARLALA